MRRTIRLTNFDSPIQLKSRIQRLQEIQSAGPEKVRLDSFDIRFRGPDCGWLDSKVYVNGKEVYRMDFSDVYDPFEEIVKWLLSLISRRPSISVLSFDCENYYQQIVCDYLGNWKRREDYQDVALFTLCCDWRDDEPPAYMILPVEEFVYKFYYGLLDYYIANKPTFMIEWGNECEWDDNLFILDRVLRYSKLEKILPRRGEAPKPFTPSADFPVTEEAAFSALDSLLSESDRKELFTVPRSDDTGRRYRELGVWLRNNWLYSPDGESREMKERRFKCYQMMSDKKTEDGSSWDFSDTHYVPYEFLDRYEKYLKTKST
jgi:hypothetical protein